jgi:hypothetical protein
MEIVKSVLLLSLLSKICLAHGPFLLKMPVGKKACRKKVPVPVQKIFGGIKSNL